MNLLEQVIDAAFIKAAAVFIDSNHVKANDSVKLLYEKIFSIPPLALYTLK